MAVDVIKEFSLISYISTNSMQLTLTNTFMAWFISRLFLNCEQHLDLNFAFIKANRIWHNPIDCFGQSESKIGKILPEDNFPSKTKKKIISFSCNRRSTSVVFASHYSKWCQKKSRATRETMSRLVEISSQLEKIRITTQIEKTMSTDADVNNYYKANKNSPF